MGEDNKKLKTIIYIDGFNLYYGLLKNTEYKWLNVEKLFKNLLPNNKIIKIKYFTADIKSRNNDDGSSSRQKAYLQALLTLDNVEIIKGYFSSHRTRMKNANPPPNTVEVIKTEEKGSDVNLSVHLLNDAWKNEYECAVLVSNDSDMAESLRIVKENDSKKVIGLISTQKKNHHSANKKLKMHCDFVKRISNKNLKNSQFEQEIQNTNISKPTEW